MDLFSGQMYAVVGRPVDVSAGGYRYVWIDLFLDECLGLGRLVDV